jgi:hypothetical protein
MQGKESLDFRMDSSVTHALDQAGDGVIPNLPVIFVVPNFEAVLGFGV